MRADAGARADALIAAAAPEDQAALRQQYAAAGSPRWTQEVAAGLNAYLVGDSLKWQTDFTWLRTVSGTTGDELRLRTQLQLSF